MATWVFLRGLTRSSAHWGGFIAEFESAVPDKVIALDLPGNGLLWQQPSPQTVADMVDAYRAQLQTMGVTGPVSILAVSMGGMVATEWAARRPQEVSALVLISTSMRPLNPVWERLRPTGFLTLLIGKIKGVSVQQTEQTLLRLTSNHARYQVLPDWCAEREKHPVSARNALRQLMAAARFRAPLQAPAMPTLILGGEGDRLVSVRCSLAVARQWGCELRLHPTAGHDLTLDDAPWVIDELTRWLQRASLQGR